MPRDFLGYPKLRGILNEGGYAIVLSELFKVPKGLRCAEWHYLAGLSHLGCRHLHDAMNDLCRACRLEPKNEEYQKARDELRLRTAPPGSEARATGKRGNAARGADTKNGGGRRASHGAGENDGKRASGYAGENDGRRASDAAGENDGRRASGSAWENDARRASGYAGENDGRRASGSAWENGGCDPSGERFAPGGEAPAAKAPKRRSWIIRCLLRAIGLDDREL